MLNDDTEIGEYFCSNLLAIRKAISHQEFTKFGGLDTNSERIGFILSYPEAHSLPLEVENPGLKSSEKALQLKDAGNKFYARGEFRKALETYSNAVLLAPREELGVILANRSAALYNLERHDYALEDAKEALRAGYPRELLYKLEERKARCFLGLRKHGEAVEAFRTALKALDYAKIPLEKKRKLEADIRVMLSVIEKGNELAQKANKVPEKTKTSEQKNSVPKIQKCNPLYPACSSAVKIADEGGDIGRHAVATRKIEPGELLIVEKPHCAFLLGEYRLTHCHRCFSRIFAPTPAACNTCSIVAYCSIRCRNADAQVHRMECKLLPALWMSKTSVTCFQALKTVIQIPFEDLYKMKDRLQATKGKLEISVQRPYRGENYEEYYSLVTHADERSAEDNFHRAYIASWLLRLLKLSPYFPEDVKTPDTAEGKLSDGELFIGGLILHNLMLLQFNSHEISELTKPRSETTLAKAKSIFIGGGLYPTVSLLNHSCNPGIVRYFIGTTMIVRAARTIAEGDDISENYGPIFTTTPETERKRKLRVQYWFDCNCEACTAHWPLLDHIDPRILRFKCETGPSCGNVLPIKTDANEFMAQCFKCGKSTNILKGLKVLQDTDALFKVASRHLEDGEHEQALKTYLNILTLLDEHLALPIRDYHLCQQGVRLCMLTLGNTAII